VTLTKKVILPILFLSAGILVFVALKITRAQQPPAEIKERIWRVDVQQVTPATLSPVLTLYGKVESPSVLKAAAPGEAIVEQVLVKEGDSVSEGQLLLQLDDRDFLPRLDQARAEVEQLEAEIASESKRHQSDLEALDQERRIRELARASVSRAERLQKKNMGSDSALDEARQGAARQALVVISREYSVRDHANRQRQLQARLLRAQASFKEIELELERSRMLAPFDGIVARVAVAPGDRVSKADVMLEMYAPRSLEVRARIPAPYRDELQQSLRTGEPVVGQARVGDADIEMRLERLSGQADPRGIDGLFHIEEGLRWLRLGEMIHFRLRRPPREKSLAVPYQALHGGNRLYLLEDGRMRGVEVQALGSVFDGLGEELLLVSSEEIQGGAYIVITHLPNAITGLRAEAVQ
jgi:multidrug efflux pump subunit AcrA (membrane-fusion protein)